MSKPFQSPIPAATLVVMRDRVGGPPELLMVERAKAMAFAGGALVFPGGRIDPGDYAMAELAGAEDVEEHAARIAAIRETVEEAALPIGLAGLVDEAALDQLRAGLHAGRPFAELLHQHGVTLRTDTLVPFARWRPHAPETRVFDTRFYLTELPAGSPEARPDTTESVRCFWATACQVLEDADAGRVRIIFPTRRNLERLAQFDSFADAVAHARAHPVRPLTPRVEMRAGEQYLCIPDDLGYPVTSQLLRTVMRG